MPFFVDDEVVDKHRLPRCGRGHRQSLAPCEHVDKAALSHVTAPNQGVLGEGGVGAHVCAAVADEKFCGCYFHKGVGNDGVYVTNN